MELLTLSTCCFQGQLRVTLIQTIQKFRENRGAQERILVLNLAIPHGMSTHIPLARTSHMALPSCKGDGICTAFLSKSCFGRGNTFFGWWIISQICYNLWFDRWEAEDILGWVGWPDSHLKGHFRQNKLIEDALKWTDLVLRLFSISQSRPLWWKDDEESRKDGAKEVDWRQIKQGELTNLNCVLSAII